MSFQDEATEPFLGLSDIPPPALADALPMMADDLAQLVDRACQLFRDVSRQHCPTKYDADELVRLAMEVQRQVREQQLQRITGRPSSELVETDDVGSQSRMAAAHNARADELEQGAA